MNRLQINLVRHPVSAPTPWNPSLDPVTLNPPAAASVSPWTGHAPSEEVLLTKADILAAVEALKAAPKPGHISSAGTDAPFIPICNCEDPGWAPCPVHGQTFGTVTLPDPPDPPDPPDHPFTGADGAATTGPCSICGEPVTGHKVIAVPGPRRPQQQPLFHIPPPAVPCGWALEWRWRPGETNWLDGQPKDTSWSPYATYKCRIRLKQQLRRARYSDHWKRKEFRVRPVLYDYQGDIVYLGPPEPSTQAK